MKPLNDGYFQFKVGLPSGNYQIKIVHLSGYFICSDRLDTSTLGCYHPLGADAVWIVLTSDTSNQILLPGPKGLTVEAGVRPSQSSFAIYNDVIQLSEGQNLRFWYKEDIDHSTGPEWDNKGIVKFRVYATNQD